MFSEMIKDLRAAQKTSIRPRPFSSVGTHVASNQGMPVTRTLLAEHLDKNRLLTVMSHSSYHLIKEALSLSGMAPLIVNEALTNQYWVKHMNKHHICDGFKRNVLQNEKLQSNWFILEIEKITTFL